MAADPRMPQVVGAGDALISQPGRVRAARWLAKNRARILERWYKNQLDADRLSRYDIVPPVLEKSLVFRSFLGPLFDVFVAYLRTLESRYRAVYLDERLRYAPHQAGPETRRAFFEEVLPEDSLALLAGAPAESEETITTFVTDLHSELLNVPTGHPLRLVAVGDCLLNEIRVFLPHQCRARGIDLDIRCLYFSAAMGRGISTDNVVKYLDTVSPELVSFSFLTYEGLPHYKTLCREADSLSRSDLDGRIAFLVGQVREFLAELRTTTDATFLVHNASGLPLTRIRKYAPPFPPLSPNRRYLVEALNVAIAEATLSLPNAVVVDEWDVALRHGHRACTRPVIPPSIAGSAEFHTTWFGEHLTQPYLEILESYRDLHKAKVLCIDFDNTLWDGVMADGEVRHHADRQSVLRQLKEAGILLVALSKNSPENIRWSDMALSEEDFVALKINWNLKVQSIEEAAAELNLGLDSFVVIDDNPAERSLITTNLPAVRVLDATDPATWRSLTRLLAFPNTGTTEEARQRTELYRAQAQRREAQSQDYDYPAMMASLELTTRFGLATPADFDRITELVQRTNQFNTTTTRYSRSQIETMATSNQHSLYVADLADKFGALGLVAVVIIERCDGAAVFDSFVMSCRAMGFGLEQLVLRLVIDAEREVSRFVGRFILTDRNTPAIDLFDQAGFERTSAGEWALDAETHRPDRPAWIRVSPRV